MRRVAGGLALLLVLSGCTSEGAPTTTSTTAAPTTTSSAPPTSTTAAPPETTTTIAVTACGDSLHIAVDALGQPGHRRVGAAVSTSAAQSSSDLAVSDVNAALQQFVSDRVAAYGPQGLPGGYCPRLRASLLGRRGARALLLTIVFTETDPPGRRRRNPSSLGSALLFDLMTQEQLHRRCHVHRLMERKPGAPWCRRRLAEVLGERLLLPGPRRRWWPTWPWRPKACWSTSTRPTESPTTSGPWSSCFPWSELVPLIDLRSPYLASFAVAEGFCSTSGQEWMLEDQPGLPGGRGRQASRHLRRGGGLRLRRARGPSREGRQEITGPRPTACIPGTAEAWRDEESGGTRTLWWLVRDPQPGLRRDGPYSNRATGTFWRGLMWPRPKAFRGRRSLRRNRKH